MLQFKLGNKRMNRFRVFVCFLLIAVLGTSAAPARIVLASSSMQGSVTASAVVLPAQVTELSFLIPALVKEISVKEGDQVKAGQTLAALDTPELQYAVAAAEAALDSAEANAKVQSYRRVKDRRNGKVFFDVVPPEVRQVANAKVEQAQAALEVAQATLAQNTLMAPHDGTLASINVISGEYVQLDQVVFTLATLDHLQIETTDLSERDITIELDQQPKGLLWGMTAEVTIGE
jgi:RND family efflux transporter MFP subunit